MTVQNNSSSVFPLISLQPVTDMRDTWAALMLHFPAMDDVDQSNAMLSHLFNDFHLLEALGRLSCIVAVVNPTTFELTLQRPQRPGQIILRIPVQFCTDVAFDLPLEKLKKQGFGLVVDGLPESDVKLSEHVNMLLCDGTIAINGVAQQWLDKFNGTHVADNIATPQQYEQSRIGGFRWFTGSYAMHTPAKLSQQDTITRARLLELLELVARDADVSELEILLKQDLALAYQLFKLVGSAAFGFKVKITSFAQAINLLGRRQLQRWLHLLLYVRSGNDADGVSNSFLPRAVVRAGLMECLCKRLSDDPDVQDRAFIVGMFSLLDILFGKSLQEILAPLTLAPDMIAALLHREGTLGALLNIVEQAERGDVVSVERDLVACGITVQDYTRCLMSAYRWASRVSDED